MRKMKDSGIEWIGMIPDRWSLNKIGSIYEERNEKVSDADYEPLSVTKLGVVPQLDTAAKTDNGDNRKLIKKNDFVINSRSDRRGSCGISDRDGSCSLINTVLKPRKNMNNEYYSYVFKSENFADEYYRWGHGIVDDLWSTNWSDMKSIYIPSPSLDEQKRIANYLDSKCYQIDSIVAKQETLIEKLKEYKLSIITEAVTKGLNINVEMKCSGSEWMSAIPSHCEIVRFQDLGDFRKGPFGSAITKNMFVDKSTNTFKVYEQKNAIYKDSSLGYYYIEEDKYRELISFAVNPGDIIVSCAGTIGECFILPETCEKGIINQALMRIRINENVNARYIVYLFSAVLKYYADKYSNGSAIKNIPPFSILKKIRVPRFPYDEQCQIADWLDNKISQIDKAISRLTLSTEKLRQYEKTLIFEGVTGKIEV